MNNLRMLRMARTTYGNNHACMLNDLSSMVHGRGLNVCFELIEA